MVHSKTNIKKKNSPLKTGILDYDIARCVDSAACYLFYRVNTPRAFTDPMSWLVHLEELRLTPRLPVSDPFWPKLQLQQYCVWANIGRPIVVHQWIIPLEATGIQSIRKCSLACSVYSCELFMRINDVQNKTEYQGQYMKNQRSSLGSYCDWLPLACRFCR